MSANDTTASGGTLRDQRRRVGLSQQTLADLAGCSISIVRLLERGYEPSHSATRTRIGQILEALAPSTNEAPGSNGDLVKFGDGRADDEQE